MPSFTGGSSTEVTFTVGLPSAEVERYRSCTAVIGSSMPARWKGTVRVFRTVPGAIFFSLVLPS